MDLSWHFAWYRQRAPGIIYSIFQFKKTSPEFRAIADLYDNEMFISLLSCLLLLVTQNLSSADIKLILEKHFDDYSKAELDFHVFNFTLQSLSVLQLTDEVF